MANPSKAEPGTIKKSPAREGKSASVMKKHHYGKHTAMKGTAQGRSVMPKKIDSGSAKSPSQAGDFYQRAARRAMLVEGAGLRGLCD
jgi:hypothetical protein